jgi:hypothetical protein
MELVVVSRGIVIFKKSATAAAMAGWCLSDESGGKLVGRVLVCKITAPLRERIASSFEGKQMRERAHDLGDGLRMHVGQLYYHQRTESSGVHAVPEDAMVAVEQRRPMPQVPNSGMQQTRSASMHQAIEHPSIAPAAGPMGHHRPSMGGRDERDNTIGDFFQKKKADAIRSKIGAVCTARSPGGLRAVARCARDLDYRNPYGGGRVAPYNPSAAIER